MNLILLFENDFIEKSIVQLSDRRFEHICNILKAKIGDVLIVGLSQNKVGSGKVIEITDKIIKLEVLFNTQPPDPLNIKLMLALPRPLVLNRLLSSVASLGIKEIYLFHSKRVEKSYWSSPILNDGNIFKALTLGLEQSKDVIFPKVECLRDTKVFYDRLNEIAKDATLIVADPSGKKAESGNIKEGMVLVIGPEGGFTADEIEKFKEIGAHLCSFGERVMKVETAVISIISRLL